MCRFTFSYIDIVAACVATPKSLSLPWNNYAVAPLLKLGVVVLLIDIANSYVLQGVC